MIDFLLRRLFSIMPTLILVSMLIFCMQRLLPGDSAKTLAGRGYRLSHAGLEIGMRECLRACDIDGFRQCDLHGLA